MTLTTYHRQDAPAEATWNKERFFASWQAWEQTYDAAKITLAQIEQDAATALQSPQALAQWLEQAFAFYQHLDDLSFYAEMAREVDASDQQAKGLVGQVSGLQGALKAIIGRLEAELLLLEDTLTAWLQEASQLEPYRHYLGDLLRKKQYMRSPEVEEILSLLADPLNQVRQTASELRNGDLAFKDAVDSKGEKFPTRQAAPPPLGIQDGDRQRRRTAWQHYSDGHQAMINTFASNYIAFAKAEVMAAKARGFNSVLEKRLSLDNNNLPVDVFHNLMDTCKANVGIWHKYWDVRRRALKVNQLHPYDIWVPIAANPPSIDFRQGVDWIVESVKPLGSDYAAILEKGVLQDGWVDWAPNIGKRQGAFCGPGPTVLMSYNGSVPSLSTLAHELGHALHGYYREQAQPCLYGRYLSSGSALNETAANFGQVMLRRYLRREKADDANFQLALIDEAINNFHRYFFIMPNLAQFESEFFDRLWTGKPVNAVILNDILQEIYARGYGDTLTDEADRTAVTWAQFNHLYRPFYTFQYAVGISAAHGIGDRIFSGVDGAADDYIEMISAGSSQYPLDLFNVAGIDMTTAEPVEKALGVLSSLVDQMDQLVG
ncbi:MAG: oligoendopeptidase F [Candidatus Latescibacteria bacterium]|nr:oligoendopeptidase F [Candidatus Latescibacterota bacterium]